MINQLIEKIIVIVVNLVVSMFIYMQHFDVMLMDSVYTVYIQVSDIQMGIHVFDQCFRIQRTFQSSCSTTIAILLSDLQHCTVPQL